MDGANPRLTAVPIRLTEEINGEAEVAVRLIVESPAVLVTSELKSQRFLKKRGRVFVSYERERHFVESADRILR